MAIHEDVFQSPMATVSFVERFLEDLAATLDQTKGTVGSKSGNAAKTTRWIAPPADRAKLNVDGAVAKPKCKGAVGVVCRSELGVFMGASALVIDGLVNPVCLEAIACREALDLAEDLNLGPIHISSDCMEVVKSLQSTNLRAFETKRGKSITFDRYGRGTAPASDVRAESLRAVARGTRASHLEASGSLVLPVAARGGFRNTFARRWDNLRHQASPSTSEMAEGTPVTYEDLTDELKKKYDEVKAILEADLIGSFQRTRSHGIVEGVLAALDGVDCLPLRRTHQVCVGRLISW
ncbi:hypothetical protein QYE76_015526 [Lolium multiflorum]|uniref:RNase H type-1 domain-containing protein n=1 Tax=Lolium multiflorum TaxID=4521 RepID=A0AAD8U6R2_LOLMU|nr:hypothetical protein QYE76_015526 [Lolium multiflorum]